MYYLTKEKYLELNQKFEGGHWTPETVETRWDYHNRVVELIKGLSITEPSAILEMGTMGIACVEGSHTIDYAERWNFPGKNPTYLHDARVFPWPLHDKQYELFVALRVFQHLTPHQESCFLEAVRIAKKVILVVPEHYENPVLPNAKGITYADFYHYLDGTHPNLYLPTAQGMLYYWDTENPSAINLEQLMAQVSLVQVEYRVVEKEPPKDLPPTSFLERLLGQVKKRIQ